MIDKRLMYAQGRRVGFEPGGMAGEHGMGAGVGADGQTDGQRSGNNDGGNRPTMADIAGPVTSNFTDAGPTTTDPDETTIDESTTTFAPIEQPTLFQQFVEGIKNTAKFAFKGYVTAQTFGALGLSPKAIQIGNTALGLGNQTGLTKSGSISELGINTLGSIGNLFSGNTNTGINTNSFSGNTNSFSNNNLNNNGEGGQGNADQGNADQGGVLSNEYILLLQKMQLGNFTQEEQTRFNLLKTMLGK